MYVTRAKDRPYRTLTDSGVYLYLYGDLVQVNRSVWLGVLSTCDLGPVTVRQTGTAFAYILYSYLPALSVGEEDVVVCARVYGGLCGTQYWALPQLVDRHLGDGRRESEVFNTG